MAKSAAQRQREYRQRRPEAGDNGERRLQCWISTRAKLSLDRLAAHHGTSKRTILEALLLAAAANVTEPMSDEEFNDYIDGA